MMFAGGKDMKYDVAGAVTDHGSWKIRHLMTLAPAGAARGAGAPANVGDDDDDDDYNSLGPT